VGSIQVCVKKASSGACADYPEVGSPAILNFGREGDLTAIWKISCPVEFQCAKSSENGDDLLGLQRALAVPDGILIVASGFREADPQTDGKLRRRFFWFGLVDWFGRQVWARELVPDAFVGGDLTLDPHAPDVLTGVGKRGPKLEEIEIVRYKWRTGEIISRVAFGPAVRSSRFGLTRSGLVLPLQESTPGNRREPGQDRFSFLEMDSDLRLRRKTRLNETIVPLRVIEDMDGGFLVAGVFLNRIRGVGRTGAVLYMDKERKMSQAILIDPKADATAVTEVFQNAATKEFTWFEVSYEGKAAGRVRRISVKAIQ
jgi:hypothetical protein